MIVRLFAKSIFALYLCVLRRSLEKLGAVQRASHEVQLEIVGLGGLDRRAKCSLVGDFIGQFGANPDKEYRKSSEIFSLTP